MVPEEEIVKNEHKWNFPWVQSLLQICWLYLRAEEHSEHGVFKSSVCALGELQGFCHFALPRRVSQVCTSSCLAPRLPGEPKCLSSWGDQESSISYLPLILKFILRISVAMESYLEWLPWTLLSLPLKKFPSHLFALPSLSLAVGFLSLAQCCWSRFTKVLVQDFWLIKEKHLVTSTW